MTSRKLLLVFLLISNLTFIWAQKYELKSINFEGNNEFSATRLKDVIVSKESPMWFWKFLNSFSGLGAEAIMFDSLKIPFDLAALKEYYRNNGYFETHFNYSYELDTSSLDAELIYIIDEGERSKFRSAFLFGLDQIPFITYNTILQDYLSASNEWYSQSLVEQNINNTINTLLNSGYMNARFDSTIIFRDTSANAADLNIYFTTVNRVNLQLDGNIGYMHELSPEIIVNNQQSAFNIGLGANFIKKNFFGEARKFTINSSFGIQDIFNVDFKNLIGRFSFRDTTLLGYVDARLKIEQPFLFGKPIFGTWENYATIKKQKNYNITFYGSKITFEFELPKFTFVNYLSTYYNIEQTKEVYRTNNDSLSSKLVSTIGIDLGKSTTDDFLFPTKGTNLSLQLEEANGIPFLISQIFKWNYSGTVFYKLLFTASTYQALDLKRNNILSLKLKTGYLHPYVGDYNGLPLNRTFYAGGSNSIRGWRSNELVPKDAPKVAGLLVKGINVKGGTFLLEGTLEYRYRFFQSFGLVGFFDYGNTWLNPKDFNFNELALAAGIGFRYYTQVAPFRLDFGFKLYDPSDKTFIFGKHVWDNFEFHFGIGEAF